MSGEPKDGGSAFPRPTYVELNQGSDNAGRVSGDDGMSLRDWFAGQALAGSLASDGVQSVIGEAAKRRDTAVDATWAANAYQLADAMLAERAKKIP